MIIKAGTYTGNAVDGRAIPTGNAPDLVFVSEEDLVDWTASPVYAHVNGMGDEAKALKGSTGTEFAANIIQSVTATGFTVGTGQAANADGVKYYWWAIEANGTDFEVGTYTGNASDGRDITLASITGTPALVMVFGNVGNFAVWRSNVHSGDASQLFDSTVGVTTNLIQAFGTGTFQVGTSTTTNGNLTTYYYAAFTEVAGVLEVITFTGDGNDDRTLTGAGFQPDLAFVQRRDGTGRSMAFRHPSHVGDRSWGMTGESVTDEGANQIQAFTADGIQVGTSLRVNTNTAPYTAIFMKTTASSSPPGNSGNAPGRGRGNPNPGGGGHGGGSGGGGVGGGGSGGGVGNPLNKGFLGTRRRIR